MNKPTFEIKEVMWESEKWKNELQNWILDYANAQYLVSEENADPQLLRANMAGIVSYVSNLLAEQKKEILSQTEQECDKKWRERIEGMKIDLTKMNRRGAHSLGEDYNLALDDLLNNK